MGIPLWLISLAIGVAVGFLVVGVMKGQLKTVRRQNGAGSYLAPGSLQLRVKQDIYLYENTTRIRIQQDEDN